MVFQLTRAFRKCLYFLLFTVSAPQKLPSLSQMGSEKKTGIKTDRGVDDGNYFLHRILE